ncbi:MAG TPA: MXAN_5187 C-terminal domain-containing protein [Kofleriaceae bacterium]|nr:MXAN_5187 C-terminal domain-containing protein [Kofleriaceae bacterium]
MSRTIIGGLVAILIAALTAVVYIIVTSSLPGVARREAREQVTRVPDQAVRTASLEALDLSKRVEEFAAEDAGLRAALTTTDAPSRGQQADLAFGRYRDKLSHVRGPVTRPSLMVLVNSSGDVVAREGVNNPLAGEFKKDNEVTEPGIKLAIGQRAVLCEVWNYQGGLFRVGIASVIDPTVLDAGGQPKILGAVIVGQSLDNEEVARQGAGLGTEAAYVDGGKVFATSFARGKPEGAGANAAIGKILPQLGVHPVRVTVAGDPYLAVAVPLPRISSVELPEKYPPVTASMVVLVPESRSIPEHGKAGKLILLLGGLSLVLALAGMHFGSKRILDQVDQLEVGVNEIINGNTERTFRPVGSELDGLANGLNVMLARLLGRPEPSDDDFDEDDSGTPAPVEIGEASRAHSAADAELAALAAEPEADYYRRVHGEYRAAREAAGNPDPVSLESFTAKLRVNESKLKAQHHCRMVRFKVVTADGKVTLKPLPIA